MSFNTAPVFSSPTFLCRVLQADAASCFVTGAAQVAAAPALSGLLGLPNPLLLATGAFLLVYSAVVLSLSMRSSIPRTLVGVVIAGNLLWAVDCVWLVVAGPLTPTLLGQAWLLAQAAVVVILAELQWIGLRAARR